MAHRGGGGGVEAQQQHHQPQRMIGNYIVTQQIGAGAFAVVWKARHKLNENVVAIKEIATDKLNPKLQDSLRSEIQILKKTSHPNIIRLYDVIEVPNRIFLVLEYCIGGDLSAYIQRHGGRVSENVARHFMRQLGDGLQVLRANNLIHRDLKPQNLLLSTTDFNAVLKIADFGFARSLQPQGMAETICGSPLYMAPEILQRQKYDAKADLWSVGAILFQLLTGRPPFSGNSHVQLLFNIVGTNEVKFPEAILSELHPDCVDLVRKLLHRNPLERLSFEEFFDHKFMGPSRGKIGKECGRQFSRRGSESPDTSQDEGLPFFLEDDSQSPRESLSPISPVLLPDSPPGSVRPSGVVKFPAGSSRPIRGIPLSNNWANDDKMSAAAPSISLHGTSPKSKNQKSQDNKQDFPGTDERMPSKEAVNPTSLNLSLKGMGDSLENIDDYVVVGPLVPSTESMSLSIPVFGKGSGSPIKVSTLAVVASTTPAVPPSEGNQGSVAQDPFQRSLEGEQFLEVPSSHPQTRVSSLRSCARLITELATDKLEAGQVLDSFAIQLVCLAVWKESLHACHTWAAAAAEGNGETFSEGAPESNQVVEAASACSLMEREFLVAVDRAEALVSRIEALDGCTEMRDAMDLIYQAALAVGRVGAVEEFSGNTRSAAVAYAKAVALFYFLLVEAPSLPLNPRLVLNPDDRQRLRRYVDVVTIRQNHCLAAHKESIQDQQFT